MSSEYKVLAAAVVKQAVDDLADAYKKVRVWDEMEKSGNLRRYVEKKQAAGNSITLTHDDLTAIEFFREDSNMYQLYFGMLNIDEMPTVIKKQRDFIKENATRLIAQINYFKRHMASKEATDQKSGQKADTFTLNSQF